MTTKAAVKKVLARKRRRRHQPTPLPDDARHMLAVTLLSYISHRPYPDRAAILEHAIVLNETKVRK